MRYGRLNSDLVTRRKALSLQYNIETCYQHFPLSRCYQPCRTAVRLVDRCACAGWGKSTLPVDLPLASGHLVRLLCPLLSPCGRPPTLPLFFWAPYLSPCSCVRQHVYI